MPNALLPKELCSFFAWNASQKSNLLSYSGLSLNIYSLEKSDLTPRLNSIPIALSHSATFMLFHDHLSLVDTLFYGLFSVCSTSVLLIWMSGLCEQWFCSPLCPRA